MKVTVILADAAQEAKGKLFILGGGWNVVGPNSPPTALALLVEVPWTEANRPHDLRVTLQDPDGNPALVGPESEAIELTGQLEVGRPPGSVAGNPFNVPMVINIPSLPLEPSSRYIWVVEIDGEEGEGSRAAFDTRARSGAQPPGS